MFSHHHVIGKQVLDLEIEDGSDALGLQTEISELFWKDVVPAMNRLFDHRVPPEIVLRFDRLEIDLGRLDPGRLRETFPAKVCEALESELAPFLALGSRGPLAAPGETERRSQGEHVLSLWHHLLSNGYLPWWAPAATAADLEVRVEEHLASLDRLPSATERLLREDSTARRRFALQGSAATQERVLRLADKGLADASLPMLDAMIALLRTQPTASIPPERFRQVWWEAALAEASLPSSGTTSMRSLGLLRQAIVLTARNASVAYPDLLARLRSLVEPPEAPARKTVPTAQWQDLSAALRDIEEAGEPTGKGVEYSSQALQEVRGHQTPAEGRDRRVQPETEAASPPRDLTSASAGTGTGSVSSAADESRIREGTEARQEASDKPLSSPMNQPSTQQEKGPKDMATTEDGTSVSELPERLEESSERGISAPGKNQAAPRKDEKPPHLFSHQDGKTIPKRAEETGEAEEEVSRPRRGRAPPGEAEMPAGPSAPPEATFPKRVEETSEAEEEALPSRRGRAPPGGAEKPAGPSAPPEAKYRQPESETARSAPGEEASPPGDSAAAREDTGIRETTTAGKRLRPGDDSAANAESARSGALRGEDRRSRVSATPASVERTSGLQRLSTVAGAETGPGMPASTKGPREGEVLYVDDAGIVLLHPFLQMHFEHLGLLRDKRFVDEQARERAVHQLHFLATGEEEPEEYLLVVAKLLCGLEPEEPIARRVPIDDHARSQAEELLAAVIRHWQALKNSSPDGLREAFLQRKGRLTRKADGWRLKVESNTLDILLYRLPDIRSRLPWSISVVRLPWMPQLLWVDWV